MSDSLLNLLEVLNEVLEEEKLQEQASGGAPTEDELWDIVSPGLVKTIEDKKQVYTKARSLSSRQRTALPGISKKYTNPVLDDLIKSCDFFIEQLSDTNKNLIYAFPIIEHELDDQKNIEDNRQKILGVGAWLFRLNKYYRDGNAKLEIPPRVFASIYGPEYNKDGSTKTPFDYKKSQQDHNRQILRILSTDRDSHLRKIGLSWEEEGQNRLGSNLKNSFKVFLNSLSQGKGFFLSAGAFHGTTGSVAGYNLAYLAEPREFLDNLDYEKARSMILSGDTSQAKNAVSSLYTSLVALGKAIDKKEIAFDYTAHKEKVITILKSSLDKVLKKPVYSIKLAIILKNTYGNKQTRKKYTNQLEFLNVVDEFIENVENNADYQNKLIKAKSGETFTEPKVSPYGTLQNKDFDRIIRQFFGSNTEATFEQKIDMLFKKMQIFTLSEKKLKNEIKKIDTRDFMNRVLLLEYFVKMSKGFSRVTAGLLFEYFLAKLFNGKVTGIKNDAVDFITGQGVKGSAKLHSRISRDEVQSVSAFQPHIGEEIIYVIGKKEASEQRITINRAVEPLEIEKVKIYVSKVRFDNKKTENDNYILNIIGKDGEVKATIHSNKDENFYLQPLYAEENYTGTLQIMMTTEDGIKGFRQRVKKAVSGDTKKILDLVEELFKNLRLADEKSRIYTSSGEVSDGTAALKALTDSQTNLRQIGDYAFTDKKDEYDKLPEPNDT
jgi:hypothetical protein